MIEHGAPWVLCFEINHSAAEDLLKPEVRAQTPGLRGSMREKVRDGNSHNDFCADLLPMFEKHGIFFVFENPDTSWWWRRRWRRWRPSDLKEIFRLCFCRLVCGWKKATRIATNTRLAGVRMMCTCKRAHIRLRGMHSLRKIPWTQVALTL